ncbi:hypothetical protein [Neorhizobium galegae]|uniref:hypothetical protein n=1 Tax=Neorhizobium galegae TaxID=399 RepID=UPI00062129E2|nr:hypothetical protein [Neorhizobium galegae]CDZ48738.1 Hypothetical protein NGAL_HAMBI2427_28240 [Neorhizobium galegae bv. orientalis]
MDAITSNGLLGVAVFAAFVACGIIIPFYVIKPPKDARIANAGSDGGWAGGSASSCDSGSAGGACDGGGGGDGGGD